MKLYLLAGVIISSTLSLHAHAVHIDMKAGLWEHKFTLVEAGAGSAQQTQQEQMLKAMNEMKKQYATMPAEQRKVIDQMMEQQGIKVTDQGIDMASKGLHISKDGTTLKVCLTQQQIDEGQMPPPADNCEQKITQSAPNVLKITYTCRGDNPFKGESDMIFQNSKSYSGKGTYTTTVADKSETYHAEQTGKWLSSDCGDIKPVNVKPQL